MGVALTCKYMGWDWNIYMRQPLEFLQIINMMRQLEAEEAERQAKNNG